MSKKILTLKEVEDIQDIDFDDMSNGNNAMKKIDDEKNLKKKIAQYKVIGLTIKEMAQRTGLGESRIKKLSASMKDLLDDYDKTLIKKQTLGFVKMLNEETWKDYNFIENYGDNESLKVKSTLRKEMDDRYKNMLRLFGMSEEKHRIEMEGNDKMSSILTSLGFKENE